MPEADPLGGLGGMVAALAEKLVRITDRVGKVEDEVRDHEHGDEVQVELAKQVEALREQVEKLLAVEKPVVWDWTVMDDEEAAQAWKALVRLVREVLRDQLAVVHWTPKPDDGQNKLNKQITEKLQAVPDCWMQHRDVVWLLTALCQAWAEIHGPGGRVAAALDWDSRHLPAVISRLALSSAQKCLRGCALGGDGFGWDLDDTLTRVSKRDRDRDRRRLAEEAQRAEAAAKR
ncbi:MAG: hypothetical protein AUG49_19010 [Catenulispora sp. 13_1_20CM_3_70_7]|nr:MAG: hypothetical protein AUG49_19010 [Catenulispora sp. 13_1_20CM_3_70_7]